MPGRRRPLRSRYSSAGAGGPSDSDGTVELSWWGSNPTDYKAAIKEFEKENPDIKVTFKQFADNDYMTALRPGLTSSDGPDVFQVQPGEPVTNFGPLAVPLEDPMAAEYGDDWPPTSSAEPSQDSRCTRSRRIE